MRAELHYTLTVSEGVYDIAPSERKTIDLVTGPPVAGHRPMRSPPSTSGSPR